jgi:DNA polymerase I
MIPFREVWLVDTEYNGEPGDICHPVCLVAHELYSARTIRLWEDELSGCLEPPYPIGADSLFVCYYSPAELGFHLALGWSLPVRILDLWLEFRLFTNGKRQEDDPEKFVKTSLVNALFYFGLDSIGTGEKTEMRDLILRGGPWTLSEQQAIFAYCESDVVGLGRLLPALIPRINLEGALYRSQYMRAIAHMEHAGVPIDLDLLGRLNRNWDKVRTALVRGFDPGCEIFDDKLSFQQKRFAYWLVKQDIPWPRTESGRLALNEETFAEMVKIYPGVRPVYDALHALSQMRLNKLAVGKDGRNRTMLSPYRARTSRNQPSNAKFIFGPSVWIRSLIKPEPGWAIAYIDWEQQEFGIAAVLSGDPNMIAAYVSGDPYLAFAIQARALAPKAKEKGNETIRDLFKQCCLGVNYGMQEVSLAFRIMRPVIVARSLLQLHRETFRRFWLWSDAALNFGAFFGYQESVFGWRNHVFPNPNPQSLRNFPMQANGAEMLRIACCLTVGRGVQVCAPIHDALLIAAPKTEIEHAVQLTERAMAEASAQVLDGFCLRTEHKIVRAPCRYWDKRGKATFQKILSYL